MIANGGILGFEVKLSQSDSFRLRAVERFHELRPFGN
jgi:hypothetical protein